MAYLIGSLPKQPFTTCPYILLTPRKCGVFEVCREVIPSQVSQVCMYMFKVLCYYGNPLQYR